MGIKAARMQRARTRALVTRIERKVSAHEAQRPEQVARDRRIKAAKRDARRALRACESAKRGRRVAEVAAGAAIRRLLAEGLSQGETAVLAGLSSSAARRLIRVATDATDPAAARPSTDHRHDHAPVDVTDHGETGDDADGATSEGNS